MKLKISKSQWELIGKKTGWIKEAGSKCSDDCEGRHCKGCGKHIGNYHDSAEERYLGQEYSYCDECNEKKKSQKNK